MLPADCHILSVQVVVAPLERRLRRNRTGPFFFFLLHDATRRRRRRPPTAMIVMMTNNSFGDIATTLKQRFVFLFTAGSLMHTAAGRIRCRCPGVCTGCGLINPSPTTQRRLLNVDRRRRHDAGAAARGGAAPQTTPPSLVTDVVSLELLQNHPDLHVHLPRGPRLRARRKSM